MDNYNNYYDNAGQPNFAGQENYQNAGGLYGISSAKPSAQNQVAPQQNGVAQPQSVPYGGAPTNNQDNNAVSFADPNSFVPQSLRQFNTFGRYFTTRGRDQLGRECKFYFTQEERDYLSKFNIKAQEFYDRFQSKLGGQYVLGDPNRTQGFAGPSFKNPSSFVPGDMRGNCPERNYVAFAIRDEIGLEKIAYLTQEEIDFTRVANMDISTYVNVYQREFDYDKGQMEQAQASVNVATASAENVLTPSTSNATN